MAVMHEALLATLAKTAHFSRLAGLGQVLAWGRDSLDSMFMTSGIFPLAVEMGGIEISGYLRHRSFLHHLVTGKYEPFTRELFERSLKPGTIVIDGGAHIGYYSLLADRILGSDGKIFAFEPDPHNFSALVANIRRNHCINVIPIAKALSNSIGYVTFYQSSGTISSSLIHRPSIGKTQEIRVTSTTLDTEMEGLTCDDILIKLDLEGSELSSLQGMRRVFQRSKSAVLFAELNPSALADAGLKPHDLITELKNVGFQVDFVHESKKELIPIIDRTVNLKGNLYCKMR